MRFPSRLTVVLAAVLMLGGGASGQDKAPADGPPSYTARVTAIMVDAVVRDRHGKPVLDLGRDDFEIFEDDVRQDIASFTLISKGAGVGIDVRLRRPESEGTAVIQPTGTAASAETFPSVVALVFDALTP
jgi:hypothetical protein